MRTVAAATSAAMAWLTVGPGICVAVAKTPKPTGHARHLSALEMQRIVGSQGLLLHHTSYADASGPSYPWEGSYSPPHLDSYMTVPAIVNTGNGNTTSSVPIVGWNVRGGRLKVDLSLVHNSQSTHNSELGQKWTHSYDIYLGPDPTTSSTMDVHWGNDLSYGFTQNVDGSYSPPTGIYDKLTVSGSGTSAVYTLTKKDQTVYTFGYISGGGAWYCGSIADRNGNAITIAHDSGGNVTSVTDPTSRAISFTYTSGVITGITDPLGRTWTVSYDGSGNLSGVSLPAVGGTTYSYTFGYNANHDLTSLTDLRGKTWTRTYNSSDDSIATDVDPLSNSTSYTYHSGYTAITDPNGHNVTDHYTSGLLTSKVDQIGDTESYSYDSNFDRTTITDKRGYNWTYTFDSMGNVLTKTDPLSHETVLTYNSNNDPLTVTDPLSHETSLGYDSYGNLTMVTDALSHEKTMAYDSHGSMISVSDALSHVTCMYIDTNGNCYQITDPLGHSTSMTFDAIGRQTGVTDATGDSTTTSYDGLERISRVTAPGSRTTTCTYSGGSGLKLTVTDPMSHVETYTYDDAGRVTSDADPNSHTVYFGYDANGNKTSFEDGNGHTTDYTYTNRNELSGESYPDSTSESWTYLATGQHHTHTDGRSITSTDAYDNAGRLTGTSYSDSTHSVSFGYDNANRKTSMVDGSGTTTYSYDNANRPTAIAQPNGTVDFSYDNADRVSVRTLAGVGDSTFTYDNGNRVTSVAVPGASGSETTDYTYDAANRELTTTFADGSVETDGYDGTTADLTSVVNETSASAVIASYAYTYNSDGRKTQATLSDGSYYSYGYDSAGQLTSESLSSGGSGTIGALHGYSYSYAYDSAGNRTSKTVGGTTTSYTYDSANKLTAAGTKSYAYDNAGSVTSVYNSATGLTTTLSYDAESRITAASNNPTVGAYSDTFAYNGTGQRYSKSDSTGSFSYTRQDDDIDSPVLSDGAAVYNHSAGGSLVSEVRGSASKFYHSDALGSTAALTNASGSTTDTLVTDAYGMPITSSGSTPTPFGFVGQGGYQGDSDTGLMLVGHRYYDASAGRFLSRDQTQAGYNWYGYCGDDPVNATDPEGLDPLNKQQKLIVALGLLLLTQINGNGFSNQIAIIQKKLQSGQILFDPTLNPNADMQTNNDGTITISPTVFKRGTSMDAIAVVAADLAHEAVHNDMSDPAQGPNPAFNNFPMRRIKSREAEIDAYKTTIAVISAIVTQTGGKLNGPYMKNLMSIATGCENGGPCTTNN